MHDHETILLSSAFRHDGGRVRRGSQTRRDTSRDTSRKTRNRDTCRNHSKPAGSVLASIYSTNRAPSEFADQEKAADLLRRRAELAQKIQNERKRILKEDAKAKELYDEIMRLNRQLASLLEAKKSMIELNSQLLELDSAISKLKPAPAPETEAKDVKKEDVGKADNTDKSGKTDNADKTGKAGKE